MKEQSSSILAEKSEEISQLLPAIKGELATGRGEGSMKTKDYMKLLFKNQSYIDNIAARESSRGRRRTDGTIEEVIGVDGTILNEIIIPTMNIDRLAGDGKRYEDELLNKSQIYITTAGYKNTFSYNKLIQVLVRSIVQPERAIVMGGTWRLPVLEGLQSRNFINEIRADATFNSASFDREYESLWAGTVEDAFFNGESFDRNRIVVAAESKADGKIKTAFYVISVDVGRFNDLSAITVIKVSPQNSMSSIKSVVNLYSLEGMHFEEQAIFIKQLYYKFNARRIVIDANGVGAGLVDYLVKSQTDRKTGEYYPPFGVYNDPDEKYKFFKTIDTEDKVLFLVKANAPFNTEMYTILQTQLNAGKVKFLIDERQKREKMLSMARSERMSRDERDEYLRPFVLTSVLREELLNLREQTEGVNIILSRANKNIKKDKVSSLGYGLYYIKTEEDDPKRRRHRDFSKFVFFN